MDDENLHGRSDIGPLLIKRLQKDKIYSLIGDRVLIAVKPQRPVAKYSLEDSKKHALKAKSADSHSKLEPHIFDFAQRAYWHCLRELQDQSLVLMYHLIFIIGVNRLRVNQSLLV